jgi:hypothetical protein
VEWANVLTSLVATLAVAVGLPLALRKRKKESCQKRERFFYHCQAIDIIAWHIKAVW